MGSGGFETQRPLFFLFSFVVDWLFEQQQKTEHVQAYVATVRDRDDELL